jgi:hypothetical protein
MWMPFLKIRITCLVRSSFSSSASKLYEKFILLYNKLFSGAFVLILFLFQFKQMLHGTTRLCLLDYLKLHTKLAPAANYGTRFCGKLVGAREDARRSDFGIRHFRARPRGLQCLGAIGPMVLARRARQNGSNRGLVAPSLQSLHQVL